MTDIRDFSYRYNINRGDNDIFNVSVSSNKQLNVNSESKKQLQSSFISTRCVTPYSNRIRKGNESYISNMSNQFIKSPSKGSAQINNSYFKNNSVCSTRGGTPNKNNTENKSKKIKEVQINIIETNNNNFKKVKFQFLSKSLDRIRLNKNKSQNDILAPLSPKEINLNNVNVNENNVKNSNYSLNRNDSLNEVVKRRLIEQIKNRENLTDQASKSLQNTKRRSQRDFYQTNEYGPGFLDKFVDHVKNRAKETSQIKENLIMRNMHKFINVEPTAKSDFYKSYVDNVKSNVSATSSIRKKFIVNLRDDSEFKKKYTSDLKDQINMNERVRKESKNKIVEQKKEICDRNMSYYERESRVKFQKNNSLTQNLLFANLQIINDKYRLEKAEKENVRSETKLTNQIVEKKLKDEIKSGKDINNFINQKVREHIQLQIQDKKNTKIIVLSNSISDFKNSMGLNFSCDYNVRKKCDITKHLK